MKKIFLSLLAVAAVAACAKSEIEYEAAGEISFAPVASNITKSVAGYDGDTFDGVFPTAVNLYVFANAGTGAAANHTEEYFKNAKFVWNSEKGSEATQNGVATSGAYAGDPTRYWPNVKTLVFAGYSDACGINTTAPTMDFTSNVLTIPSYTQNNGASYAAEGKNDLMWFVCDGSTYGKDANEIAASMKHACSWITIKVAGDDVTANSWKLNNLVVKSLAHTGAVACGTTADWDIEENAAKADEAYYTNTAGATFTKTAAKFEDTANNFIVLPQTPTNLEVTYTYVSDATNNLSLTETKSVPLAYDEATTDWQPGVHYIYNITITATEILIDPVVVDWTAYTGNNIEKEVE